MQHYISLVLIFKKFFNSFLPNDLAQLRLLGLFIMYTISICGNE